MQLFYNPTIAKEDSEIIFDKDESRHIHKVLRMKSGDSINISNGQGLLFHAQITSVAPKQCIAKIIEVEQVDPLPYHLHLAVAPTKLNDRYEWFLEKATEIGISEITPIICDRSERKVVKIDRYQRILQSALKQSLKAYLPILNDPVPLKEFIPSQANSNSNKFIAHCEKEKKNSLKSVLKPKDDVLILIGPEGDFSSEEITFSLDNGFKAVSLGTSRLRTETAAIVACHSVAFVNE